MLWDVPTIWATLGPTTSRATPSACGCSQSLGSWRFSSRCCCDIVKPGRTVTDWKPSLRRLERLSRPGFVARSRPEESPNVGNLGELRGSSHKMAAFHRQKWDT